MLKLVKSNNLELAKLAQLVERISLIHVVMGSIPDWIHYVDFVRVCVYVT
jgi:hypothetical protein